MRSVRSRAVAGVVLATALVLAAAGFLSLGNGSDPGPGAAANGASPTATPAGAGAPAPNEADASDDTSGDDDATATPGVPATAAQQRKEARVTVATFADQLSTLVSGGPKRASAAAGIGTATFVDELRATADFNHASGISVEGEPRIVKMRVSTLRLGASPQRAVVVVCLDNSRVRVVDDAGRVVQKQAHSRTRQRFHLVRPEGRWLIDSQDFPANPNCR